MVGSGDRRVSFHITLCLLSLSLYLAPITPLFPLTEATRARPAPKSIQVERTAQQSSLRHEPRGTSESRKENGRRLGFGLGYRAGRVMVCPRRPVVLPTSANHERCGNATLKTPTTRCLLVGSTHPPVRARMMKGHRGLNKECTESTCNAIPALSAIPTSYKHITSGPQTKSL